MAHQISSFGDVAYSGQTPWHSLGNVIAPNATQAEAAKAANLNYTVERIPALTRLPNGNVIELPNAFFNCRSDNHRVLGTQTHTDRRVEVQPSELLEFIWRYISVDDRFQISCLGNIRGGEQIWATAGFNGGSSAKPGVSIAGEQHQAYLLARTSFDGSTGTILQMTVIRAVCANTLAAALCDKRAMINLRHTVKFDPAIAARQLSDMAKSVETFKAIGDAMASVEMAQEDVMNFFKELLAIPFDVKKDDISTRKLNQYEDLWRAYRQSVREGAPDKSMWAALQAVTRYADHDRVVRKTDDSLSDAEVRTVSSQLGSGAQLKAQAMGLLLPLIKDRVSVAA